MTTIRERIEESKAAREAAPAHPTTCACKGSGVVPVAQFSSGLEACRASRASSPGAPSTLTLRADESSYWGGGHHIIDTATGREIARTFKDTPPGFAERIVALAAGTQAPDLGEIERLVDAMLDDAGAGNEGSVEDGRAALLAAVRALAARPGGDDTGSGR